MINRERCLVEITSSCRGCNVAEIARNRVKKGEKPADAIKAVSKELCPEGLTVQEESLKLPKQSIW